MIEKDLSKKSEFLTAELAELAAMIPRLEETLKEKYSELQPLLFKGSSEYEEKVSEIKRIEKVKADIQAQIDKHSEKKDFFNSLKAIKEIL